ncbi:TonB-dependent receptor [Sphingorhabdus sp.]|jgi:iron complex outermembrane receptor protein|uniref:TonB-dependent receptor n=1 Tax=Sphingorhabdus sp. TaxID=1902408 RepID=UPI0037CAF642
MSILKRAGFLPSFGILLFATTSLSTNAFAQTEPADEAMEENGLEQIVVTAQKRETDLQATPIAISVLSDDALANRRVTSLVDLADGSIPSLRVGQFARRNSALVVCIRGICPASDTNQPSRDATAGIYVDGVYLGRPQGLAAALFDVERIEVLKGPQGTLFGRNAIGGALNIVTREPSDEFSFRATAGARNLDGYSGEVHANIPGSDGLAVKIDGLVQRRDGQVSGTADGQPGFNFYDRRGFAIRALWKATETLTLDFAFDIARDETTPSYLQLLAVPTPTSVAPIVTVGRKRLSKADIIVSQQPSVGNQTGVRFTMKWNPFDIGEFRSITAYRRIDQGQYDNSAGPTAGVFRANANFARYSIARSDQDQISQELQFVGKVGRLNFATGLYYFKENASDDAWAVNTLTWNANGTGYTRLPSLAAGAENPFPDRASAAKAKSLAAYGQFTWNPPIFEDRISLTGGLRYTSDKRSGGLLKVNGRDDFASFTFSSNRVDPAVSVQIEPADDIHLYAKWEQAYRAGGANSRSLTYAPFGPETIKSTEIGIKSEFWDRRIRINLAAFKSDYSDQQVDFNRNAIVQGSLRTVNETVNVPGTSKIKGFEAEVTMNPFDGLILGASYAYTTWKIPDVVNPFNNAVSAISMVNTPKNAFTGSVDYTADLKGFGLLFHFDVNATSEFRSGNSLVTSPLTDKPVVANARIAFTDVEIGSGHKFEISVWSRNIFNEQHLTARGFNTATRFETGVFNEPRTFGVDLTVRY